MTQAQTNIIQIEKIGKMSKIVKLTEGDIHNMVKEAINNVIKEGDRHRPGYYAEYNKKRKEKGLSTDRHKDGYYAEYNEKKKSELPSKTKKKQNKKDRHRPGYYSEYNQAHPERLNRGFTKGYLNGNVNDGPEIKTRKTFGTIDGLPIIGFDEMGRPITTSPFTDMLRNKEMEWHDDDWFEGINDD